MFYWVIYIYLIIYIYFILFGTVLNNLTQYSKHCFLLMLVGAMGLWFLVKYPCTCKSFINFSLFFMTYIDHSNIYKPITVNILLNRDLHDSLKFTSFIVLHTLFCITNLLLISEVQPKNITVYLHTDSKLPLYIISIHFYVHI